MKTGWPPGLLQDDDKKLSQWFASRIDARWQVRRVCEEIKRERVMKDTTPPLMTDAEINLLRLKSIDPFQFARAIESHVRQQFAEAVAAEREDCAKLCEEIAPPASSSDFAWAARGCAAAIRSRG